MAPKMNLNGQAFPLGFVCLHPETFMRLSWKPVKPTKWPTRVQHWPKISPTLALHTPYSPQNGSQNEPQRRSFPVGVGFLTPETSMKARKAHQMTHKGSMLDDCFATWGDCALKEMTFELYNFGAPTQKPIHLYCPVVVSLQEPHQILEREEYVPTARMCPCQMFLGPFIHSYHHGMWGFDNVLAKQDMTGKNPIFIIHLPQNTTSRVVSSLVLLSKKFWECIPLLVRHCRETSFSIRVSASNKHGTSNLPLISHFLCAFPFKEGWGSTSCSAWVLPKDWQPVSSNFVKCWGIQQITQKHANW